jgi:signal transduction histidine kinase
MQTTENLKHFPHDSAAFPSLETCIFRAYHVHRSVTQSKTISPALVLAVHTLFAAPLFYQTANNESDDNLPYLSLLWALFGISILSGIYCAVEANSSVSTNNVPKFIYMFSASLFVCLLHVFSTLMNTECSSWSSRTHLCSDLSWKSYEALQLTEATMLAVLFQPLTHACMDLNRAFISGPTSIAINWMVSIASLLASNILAPSPVRTVILSAYAVLSLLFLLPFMTHPSTAALSSQIDYHDTSSITVKSQQDSIGAEGRISAAVDAKSTEMRHMIANVAHDLKTPLSSFMVGVDLIKQMIRSCEEQLQCNKQVSVDDISLQLHNIDEYVSDIKNTNSFMVMTINRVLDYAKASKGMKLVPKLETIQLFETISLPIQCMKNVQDKVLIQFDKLPDEISSQIITDKQWLQENVLCLLSNAAKYSSGGVVTISVRLVDEQPEMVSPSPTVTVSNEPCSVPDDSDDIENQCSTLPQNTLTKKLISKPSAGSPMSITLVRAFGPLARRISSTFRLNSIAPTGVLDEDTKDHPAVAASMTVASAPLHSDTSLRQLQLASENSFNESSSVSRSGVFSVRGAVQDNRYLLFEVEDTGIGMSQEAMASLFNPFKQTQKLAGGTGLGLFSLAKRVDALKGRYGARPRRDGKQGSLFWFTVPYRPDEVAAEEEQRLFRRAQRQRLKEMGHVNQGEGMPKLESAPSAVAQSPRPQLPETLRPQMLRICPSEDSASSSSVAVSVPPAISLKGSHLLPLRSPTAAVLMRGKAPSPAHFASGHRPSTHPCSTKASSPSAVSLKALSMGSAVKATFNILIAEDSPTLAKAQSMMLRRQGHRVHIAENGAIALRMYEESLEEELSRYDFILMDLQMPVMDGLEAMKRIRAQESMHPSASTLLRHWRHQFIIGVSADCSEEIIEEVHQIGADGFLAKPFAIASFESLAEELIASCR